MDCGLSSVFQRNRSCLVRPNVILKCGGVRLRIRSRSHAKLRKIPTHWGGIRAGPDVGIADVGNIRIVCLRMDHLPVLCCIPVDRQWSIPVDRDISLPSGTYRAHWSQIPPRSQIPPGHRCVSRDQVDLQSARTRLIHEQDLLGAASHPLRETAGQHQRDGQCMHRWHAPHQQDGECMHSWHAPHQ